MIEVKIKLPKYTKELNLVAGYRALRDLYTSLIIYQTCRKDHESS